MFRRFRVFPKGKPANKNQPNKNHGNIVLRIVLLFGDQNHRAAPRFILFLVSFVPSREAPTANPILPQPSVLFHSLAFRGASLGVWK